MRRDYETPRAEKLEFDYAKVVASSYDWNNPAGKRFAYRYICFNPPGKGFINRYTCNEDHPSDKKFSKGLNCTE